MNRFAIFFFASLVIYGCAGQPIEPPKAKPIEAPKKASAKSSLELYYERMRRTFVQPPPEPEIANVHDQKALRDVVFTRGAEIRPDGSWIHSDGNDFRVARGALKKITNQKYLVEIAISELIYVGHRISAAERVTDKKLLLDIALQADDLGPAYVALKQLEPSSLVEVAMHAQSSRVATEAVVLLKRPTDINFVARNATTIDVQIVAVRKATDDTLLRDLAIHAKDRKLKFTALAASTETKLLAELVDMGGDAGAIAKLRLATLEILPPPSLRISIIPSGMTYRRLGLPGSVEARGERIQVILLEPGHDSNSGIKYSVTFETKFPAIYKTAFVPAKVREFRFVDLLTRYLKAEVHPETVKQFAKSSSVDILKEAAILVSN